MALEDFLVKNNLVRLRAGLRWPQWKLALASSINVSRMSLLEQGAPPRPNEIEKLTNLFDVDSAKIWPDLGEEVGG